MDLLPLHRWLLAQFAGQSPTWLELERCTLEYWRDDDSDDGWGTMFTRDDVVEAMRELLDAGLVRRVVVDGVGMYWFPQSADDESEAQDTAVRVVFLRPSGETGEFVHTRVVFHPPTDDLGR